MSTLFHRNWRLLVLTLGVITVAGLANLQTMPRREDPELTPRNALLVTRYPGADADRVERLVTDTLEDVVDEFEEVKKVLSTSRAGISTISIELHDEVMEVDRVWSEMRDDIELVRPRLPEQALPPVLDDLDIDASTMIFSLVWQKDREPEWAIMQRYAEELADVVRDVSGTKRTRFYGVNPEEIRISIDSERLAALGLTPADVARTVREADPKVPAGRLETARSELTIEVGGSLEHLHQLRELPIRYGSGDATVRLGDLGVVEKTVADPPRQLAFKDGLPAITVAALVQSGWRIDDWAEDVDRAVAEFRTRLPGGFDLDVIFDQRRYTEERLGSLFENLVAGAGLVALVVLLIMGWRAAIVVVVSLPLTSLMVLSGMSAMDIPIHQMSVTGLIIALGLLIDNAIVMVDEVRHRLVAGSSALHAVRDSVRQLAIPLFGSTLTTVFAFMPIALMPGPAGEFVGTIAVSVSLAIVSSYFLALTVVPALTARLGSGQGTGLGFLEHGLDIKPLGRLWSALVHQGLRHPILMIAVAMAPPMMGFIAKDGLTEQFFPPSDRDQFQIDLRLDPQASIEETRRVTEAARLVLEEYESVSAVHWYLGTSAPKFYYNQLENEGDVPWFASAVVQVEAKLEEFSLLHDVQARLDQELPEGQFIVRPFEQGPPFAAPVEIIVKGPDREVLFEYGEKVRRELITRPGVTHARTTLADGVPKLRFDPETVEAGVVGYSRAALARALDSQLDGRVGGTLIEGPEQLPVRIRTVDDTRGSLQAITGLEVIVPGADGSSRWASLENLVELELEPVPGDIEHKDGARINTVQAYLKAGVLPATVLAPMEEWIASFEMPPGYSIQIGGESEQRDRAVANLMSSVGILVTLMIATLVLSFMSFRLAAVILGVAGLSWGLGFGALSLFGLPFGFTAIVGTMGLLGVAVNDSIVVLAAIRDDARARTGDPAAVARVVVRSTRHVMATTCTTAIGFLPLLLAGGGFWPPTVVTIGGGVVGATLLALAWIPAFYVITHRQEEQVA